MVVSALRNEATVPPANPMAKRIPPCGKETQEARCEVLLGGSFPVLGCAELEGRDQKKRKKLKPERSACRTGVLGTTATGHLSCVVVPARCASCECERQVLERKQGVIGGRGSV